MKLDFLTNDGSPLGVTMRTVYGDDPLQIGVGGAELALLTMCEEFQKMGHEVTLYNNPRHLNASPFEQRNIKDFNPAEDRDVLVIFRSPNIRSIPAKGYKVWWSCDQYTVGSFQNFARTVNKTVVISPFHQRYFRENYGITGTIITDLPVRIDDYEYPVEEIGGIRLVMGQEKHRHRFIWTTVPDRGLDYLWRIWPAIKRDIPDASLVITSDYRLWGSQHSNNEQYRVRWAARNDITFLGAVPRKRLIEEQLKAQIMLYNSGYDELFCIACAEAQVAGVYTLTNSRAALASTNMGTIVHWEDGSDPRGDKFFVDEAKEILLGGNLPDRVSDLQRKAKDRFSPARIAKFWEENIFENSCGN